MIRYAPFILAILGACVGVVGDDGSTPSPEPSGVATDDGLPTDDAVARAMQWADVQVPYCQAPNHKPDHDAACPSTCTRPDNPEWDPYRSDCSGFVSWAWDLPAPGRVTSTFAPFKTDITHVIAATDLRRGDAVNNDHHMMLFKGWETPGERATFLEEPGCSSATPYAHEFTADVTLDGDTVVVLHHGTFTAIRYDAAP